MSASKDDFIDALRLSKQQRLAILNKIRNRAARYNHADARISPRFPFYQPNAIVEMHHPGGSRIRYRVQAVNLSVHGFGFMHGSFCYTGTPVLIDLTDRQGQVHRFQGKIVRCQLIEGRVHEVGAAFNQPIPIGQFIQQEQDDPQDSSQLAGSSPTHLPRLRGRVLYVEHSLDNRQWMGFMTEQMGLELAAVETVEQAAELLDSQKYDLAVVDLWLDSLSGQEVVEAIRSAGHDGPIIGATAQEEGPPDQLASQYACDAVLIMPFDIDTLAQTFSRFLVRDVLADPNAAPLVSEQWSNLEMRPVILEFLDRLTGTIDQLNKLFTDGQYDALRHLAYELKSSAGGYGYKQISQEAGQVMALLDTEAEPHQLHDQLRKLIDLCASACLSSRKPGH